MERLNHFMAHYWLGVVLLAGALVCGVLLLLAYRRRKSWSLGLAAVGSVCALVALGGFFIEFNIGLWLGGGALVVLFVMSIVLIITGAWSVPAALGAAVVLALGFGGVAVAELSQDLIEAGKLLVSLEPVQPWWLVLLALIPAIVWMRFRSLAGLGPVRRWIAIGLRCCLILFLVLALAEVRLRRQNESLTVLFLVDRSLSIPEEAAADAPPDSAQARVDRRAARIEQLINESVEKRGSLHDRDRTGVILFGRRPRLEVPPTDAPRINIAFKDVASTIDGNYTNMAAAFKLALASFPEGTGKRIVLLSDGNENLGNVEEQVRLAERNGVQVDVVPLASGYRNENEVLVQSVEAPSRTEQGSRVPIRVLVRSYNPRTIVGTLTLRQSTEGQSEMVQANPGPQVLEVGPPARVRLRPGLNSFAFKQKLENSQQSYTYEAVFQPEMVEFEPGRFVQGLQGDRIQNNSASTHVVAIGQRRVLLIESKKGEHEFLIEHLREIGNSKYKVHSITIEQLPSKKEDLGVFLSNYDCVLLCNVPASNGPDQYFSEEQMEMLRSNTHDQGCGLIMVGGPEGFGSGGWQGTPVEKALPVDCDIKALKIQGKGGLVMIMHASEMADGNRWQKEIAKLAIKKLSPMDEVGVLDYDFSHKWHIPLQVIGSKRNALLALVDRMQPGDMPDFDTPLKMAYDALTDPKRELATKHVIIISDGDPGQSNRNLLSQMRSKKVTVTTVGVATHGSSQDQALKAISDATGGRFYKVANARALPSIYIKETRLVSQSFLYEKPFQPKLAYKSGPADKLPDALPPLNGFVRTTPKQSALVEIPILGPPAGDQDFPILAYWHYGLGKAVAFTSDARSDPNRTRQGWDHAWAGSEIYGKFWEQVVDWACRSVETGTMQMTTEYRDGKVKVVVEAHDANNRPITDLRLRGGVTTPGAKAEDPGKLEVKFDQKSAGRYEVEFKAEEAGSYFINAQARRRVTVMKNGKAEEVEEGADSVRAGVTIPYSPEFADLESNTALMEKIRSMSGGKSFVDDDGTLAEAAKSGEVYRSGPPRFKNLQPIWYWLVLMTGLLLFFDVAVRRIALSPEEVVGAAQRIWGELRGRAAKAEQAPQYFERLKSRKAQVTEAIDQVRSARRFDGSEATGTAPPPGADETSAVTRAPAKPAPVIKVGPEVQKEADDFASRLMKAKKRVWEERQKE